MYPRGICYGAVSQSVRPSVTSQYCIETAEEIVVNQRYVHRDLGPYYNERLIRARVPSIE